MTNPYTHRCREQFTALSRVGDLLTELGVTFRAEREPTRDYAEDTFLIGAYVDGEWVGDVDEVTQETLMEIAEIRRKQGESLE